jgi:hypothetical protein
LQVELADGDEVRLVCHGPGTVQIARCASTVAHDAHELVVVGVTYVDRFELVPPAVEAS